MTWHATGAPFRSHPSSCLRVPPYHFLLFNIKDTPDFRFSISYESSVLSQYECIFNSY